MRYPPMLRYLVIETFQSCRDCSLSIAVIAKVLCSRRNLLDEVIHSMYPVPALQKKFRLESPGAIWPPAVISFKSYNRSHFRVTEGSASD